MALDILKMLLIYGKKKKLTICIVVPVLKVLMYGSETMMCNPKYRSRVHSVQMDSLRGGLGVKQ